MWPWDDGISHVDEGQKCNFSDSVSFHGHWVCVFIIAIIGLKPLCRGGLFSGSGSVPH